mgnify:CR=1 FL=1
MLSMRSYEDAVKVLGRAKRELGEILSAFEFLDKNSLDLVLQHFPKVRDPFEKKSNMYVVIETMGGDEQHDQEKIGNFLGNLLEVPSRCVSGVSFSLLSCSYPQLAITYCTIV